MRTETAYFEGRTGPPCITSSTPEGSGLVLSVHFHANLAGTLVCSELGGEEGEAPLDAGQEAPGVRLEEVE